jgi:hypothetical protein
VGRLGEGSGERGEKYVENKRVNIPEGVRKASPSPQRIPTFL